jgi:hypothetical protein
MGAGSYPRDFLTLLTMHLKTGYKLLLLVFSPSLPALALSVVGPTADLIVSNVVLAPDGVSRLLVPVRLRKEPRADVSIPALQ